MAKVSALLSEDRVDLAPGLVEQLADSFLLAPIGRGEGLADRVVELLHRVGELDLLRRSVGPDSVPRITREDFSREIPEA